MALEKKYHEVTVQEDPNDPDYCFIPIPDELLASLTENGWKEGDPIAAEVKDGKIYFTLIPNDLISKDNQN